MRVGNKTVFTAPGTNAIKLLAGATLAALVFKKAKACDRLGSFFMHVLLWVRLSTRERNFCSHFCNAPPSAMLSSVSKRTSDEKLLQVFVHNLACFDPVANACQGRL